MCVNYSFLYLFSRFVCFASYFMGSALLSILCIFLPMCIAVYFLFMYKFIDHCHRVESELQLKSQHIIPYHISYHVKHEK
jgi:hypothetical protein